MRPTADATRRVVIVEDRAHWSAGHFPNRFAELARGYVAAGYEVEALTVRGWRDEATNRSVPFTVRRYRLGALLVHGIARRLIAVRSDGQIGALARAAGGTLRVLAMVAAARALARQLGDPPVVIVSSRVDPVLVSAVARRGSWLVNQFEPPPAHRSRRGGRLSHVLDRLSESAQRRRRPRGEIVAIAAPSRSIRDAWVQRAPWLSATVVPIAGYEPRERITDARERLGLDPAHKVALVFGATDGKDIDTVVDAFGDLPDWTLMLGGRIADTHVEVPRTYGSCKPVTFGGYVDDEMRAVLHSAADLVVLSFEPDRWRDSGTLLDAVAFGIPVVCSSDSLPAERVLRFRLGCVFPVGDAHGLAEAVRSIPPALDRRDLDRARDALSNRTIAEAQLEAISTSL